jgi:hypothetical protein
MPGNEPCAEAAAEAQVALNLAEPAGETRGIRERRPQVVDVGVEAVFHAHDAFAVGRAQSAQDAAASRCIARHLVLFRSRFPRGHLGVQGIQPLLPQGPDPPHVLADVEQAPPL